MSGILGGRKSNLGSMSDDYRSDVYVPQLQCTESERLHYHTLLRERVAVLLTNSHTRRSHAQSRLVIVLKLCFKEDQRLQRQLIIVICA